MARTTHWTARWRGLSGAALAFAAMLPATVAAQDATAYAVAGVDGDDTNILLLGTSLRPDGAGLRPVFGLQVARLQYPSGVDGDATVLSIRPSVGLGYRLEGGSVEGRVGYTFQDRDVEAPFVDGEGGGSGVVTSFQANTWATRPELLGLASYSWASDYLYTQGQAILPVVELEPGNIGVGAEVAYQGDFGGGDGEAYRAFQGGPILRYNNGRTFLVGVSGGLKTSNLREDTYYVRVTVVRYGIRL